MGGFNNYNSYDFNGYNYNSQYGNPYGGYGPVMQGPINWRANEIYRRNNDRWGMAGPRVDTMADTPPRPSVAAEASAATISIRQASRARALSRSVRINCSTDSIP